MAMINMAARTGMQRELMRARPRGTYAITHHGFCLVWLMVCACVLASVCTHREREGGAGAPTHQHTRAHYRSVSQPAQCSAAQSQGNGRSFLIKLPSAQAAPASHTPDDGREGVRGWAAAIWPELEAVFAVFVCGRECAYTVWGSCNQDSIDMKYVGHSVANATRS